MDLCKHLSFVFWYLVLLTILMLMYSICVQSDRLAYSLIVSCNETVYNVLCFAIEYCLSY